MASQIFAITVRPSTKWEEPLHVEAALENRPVARARGGGLRWWAVDEGERWHSREAAERARREEDATAPASVA
jgi:hypothetical protein